jgi:Protein of unknown function (DUF3037)
MNENKVESGSAEAPWGERACAYRILRYTPNLVRDEWVNIGVLLFDPASGERRLRLLEDQDEYNRVRRLHPQADESLLRALRDDLEDRFQSASAKSSNGGSADWLQLLGKWDDTLSNALQLAPQKGVHAVDLDAELERLYTDHVAMQRAPSRVGTPGSRAQMRSYCSQVFRQARLWDRIEKSVRASEFTFPGDPMRLDYSYRRNGTRGFVQNLSVTRAPADAKLLAYTAGRITAKAVLKTEFAAVTDVVLNAENDRHRFVRDTLRDAGIEPVAMEGFAVWVAKLKPLLQ